VSVSIVYCYPAGVSPHYTDMAIKFIESYNQNPPGVQHESIIVLNGAKQTAELDCMFSSLQGVKFLEHDNSGFDVGAFQLASRTYPADMMVFFGSSAYFKGPNWLLRMAQAKNKHGEALYGCMGNRGDNRVRVWPHIRTTGFWLSSELMNKHPMRVTKPEQRYEYEHGKDGLTSWVYKRGLKVFVVSWTGEYEWKDWDSIPGGFRNGNQSNILSGDRLTCGAYA